MPSPCDGSDASCKRKPDGLCGGGWSLWGRRVTGGSQTHICGVNRRSAPTSRILDAWRRCADVAGDLVFRAHIESIECAPLRGARLDWIIRTRVEQVIVGTFNHESFEFRVHSPSRAGLNAGMRCTITASWTGDGYVVDEDQFCGAPES